MEYIVLDLEWNQSNTGKEDAVEKLPFEIIEIGAIKLNKERVMVSEFNELIKPQVYHEMHKITSKLIHIQMQELERGRPFPEVGGDFVRWCGQEEQLFCTWGTLDLTELQRNMAYYEMPLLAPGPLPYLDVQKLFAIAYEERKIRRNLEYAIDFLHIEKDIPFHRAFSDAYYTAKILIRILEEHPEVVVNLSYDTFCPGNSRTRQKPSQIRKWCPVNVISAIVTCARRSNGSALTAGIITAWLIVRSTAISRARSGYARHMTEVYILSRPQS